MRKRSLGRKRPVKKRNVPEIGPLELALASLIENQAAFVAQHRVLEKEMAELNRKSEQHWMETRNLFRQIFELLERLPEAIRREIGFTSKP